MSKITRCALALGNIFDGITLYGSYPSFEKASEIGERLNHKFGWEWYVVRLGNPSEIDPDNNEYPKDKDEAAARLREAAPELLEALQATYSVMVSILTDSQLDERTISGLALRAWTLKIHQAINNALLG